MEVHNPKTTPRSWPEFLKEVGIIVLGVLIALSAEQAVQWLHRYQTRRQLEKDLLEEMRLNDVTLREDLQYLAMRKGWEFQEAQTIQAALRSNNIASLGQHELNSPGGAFILPNDSVWQHARESGTAALLPREKAEAYTTLFRFRERLLEFSTHTRDAAFEYRIVTAKLPHGPNGSPALSQMTPAEADELASALIRRGCADEYIETYVKLMLAGQKVLEGGSTSQDELTQIAKRAFNPSTQDASPPSQP